MGIEIHAQDSKESEYVRSVYDISEIIVRRLVRPWLWPSSIFGLTRDGKEHEAHLGVLHGFTRQVIEERKRARDGREKKEDMEEDLWGE